jgi:hypothetical protein
MRGRWGRDAGRGRGGGWARRDPRRGYSCGRGRLSCIGCGSGSPASSRVWIGGFFAFALTSRTGGFAGSRRVRTTPGTVTTVTPVRGRTRGLAGGGLGVSTGVAGARTTGRGLDSGRPGAGRTSTTDWLTAGIRSGAEWASEAPWGAAARANAPAAAAAAATRRSIWIQVALMFQLPFAEITQMRYRHQERQT